MVTHVNEIAKFGNELSLDEQNLSSTTYRNVVGTHRLSLRIISLIEEMESQSGEKHVSTVRKYRYRIENKLKEVCNDVLKVLDEKLIPTATTGQSKVLSCIIRCISIY